MDASSGPHGDLSAYKQRGDGLYVHQGLVGDISRFTSAAADGARNGFVTALHALHLDNEGAKKHAELLDRGAPHHEAHALIPPENVKGSHHLGDGTITYCGMNMLANDWQWVTAATPFSTLSSMLYVASGTSAVAMAATDFSLGSVVPAGSITNNTGVYTTGAIQAPVNGSLNTWKNLCTVAYNASLSIYEYGLFMSNANTGAPYVGTSNSMSATSLGTSGGAFLNTGNFLKGWSVQVNGPTNNTATTSAVNGLITSNNATALTFIGGWQTFANASASTPGTTTPYYVNPTMLDHKTFGVISVIAGDSIVFSYSLLAAIGG